MAFCIQCGTSLAEGSAFCSSCGARQGASADAAAPPPPVPPQAASPLVTPQGGYHAPPPPGGAARNAPPPVAAPPQWAAPAGGWSTAQASGMLSQMLNDIRGFSFKWVVPVDTALSPALLRNPTVWTMLLFGFYPLLSLTLGTAKTGVDFVRTLMIYCGLAWAGYFYYFVCKRSVDYRIGIGVMAFTAFIGINLVFVLWKIPPFSILHPMTDPAKDLVSHLLGFTLGVGVIEELTKAVPVLILAYAANKIEKPLDGIFYGALSGLGFGIVEGIQYIVAADANVIMVIIRITTLPFMHALWAGIVGYFIGLAQVNKSRGAALMLMGYAVSVVTHGTYDALQGPVALAIAAFTYLLFSAYIARSQQMVAELAQAEQAANREMAVQGIFRDTYLPNIHGAAPPTGGAR